MNREIYDLDQAIFRTVHHQWNSPVADPFFAALSWLGLGHIQALLCIAIYWVPGSRRYVWPLLVSILISGVAVSQLFKELVTRERPSHLLFAKPAEAWLYDSFPSGHTSTSFAVATMLWLLTRNVEGRKWWGPVAFAVALLIGISRIYRGVHWPTDVMAGLFAGVFSATIVFLVFDAFAPRPGEKVPPEIDEENSGEITDLSV